MARSKQVPEFKVEIDGRTYVWWLQRRPAWSRDDNAMTGMALAARDAEGQREVVLEFPPGPRPRLGAPVLKPESIPVRLVTTAIASAIAAGWDPLSRGKPVMIIVDADGQ
ncbi:hypothetical protein ABOZ73_14160 [Caulobacter sp. 73W]|uniref:Uncharacterized protein n=1 Tax=Caulobacter sp. 73W TaxID=3161137 RepID=A0AB39KQP8_9CAUL